MEIETDLLLDIVRNVIDNDLEDYETGVLPEIGDTVCLLRQQLGKEIEVDVVKDLVVKLLVIATKVKVLKVVTNFKLNNLFANCRMFLAACHLCLLFLEN